MFHVKIVLSAAEVIFRGEYLSNRDAMALKRVTVFQHQFHLADSCKKLTFLDRTTVRRRLNNRPSTTHGAGGYENDVNALLMQVCQLIRDLPKTSHMKSMLSRKQSIRADFYDDVPV